MRITNWSFNCVAAMAIAALCQSSLSAVETTLTPDQIHLNDTATTSFTDGSITLTPFIFDGAEFVQDSFNAQAVRLGIDNNGTNANAFNDGDTVVGNAGDEALELVLASGVGLSGMSYDFARADGPGASDGVLFSGFTANPLASFSVDDPRLFTVWENDILRLNIPGELFSGTEVNITFANSLASAGQTLLMTVHDTTQAGAQFPIRSISYDDEPSSPGDPGDVDGINGVTIDDFNIIRDNFFDNVASRGDGDLTGDGFVGVDDFDEWKDNFPGNASLFESQLFAPVPEPSTLMLAGVVGLFFIGPRSYR